MKKATVLVLALFILCAALCACGGSSEDTLAGTWENTAGGASINEITFFTDGTCLLSFDSAVYNWAIVNENQLKVTSSAYVFVWQFDISGNTLTLESENGQTATFKRVS